MASRARFSGSLGTAIRLQTLNRHLAGAPGLSRLPGNSGTTGFTAISAVHKAAFGFTACPRTSGFPRLAPGSAINPHADQVARITGGQLKTHIRTGCTGLAITAVVAIGSGTRSPPGTTRRLAITTVEPGKTRCTRAATGIND